MDKQTQTLITAHRSIILKLTKIIAILEQNAPDFVAPSKSVLESIYCSPPEDFIHHAERFMYAIPEILGEDCNKSQDQLIGWKKEMIDIWVMDTEQFLNSYNKQ